MPNTTHQSREQFNDYTDVPDKPIFRADSETYTPIARIGSTQGDRSIEYEKTPSNDFTNDITRANTMQRSNLINYSEAIDTSIDINVEPYLAQTSTNPIKSVL